MLLAPGLASAQTPDPAPPASGPAPDPAPQAQPPASKQTPAEPSPPASSPPPTTEVPAPRYDGASESTAGGDEDRREAAGSGGDRAGDRRAAARPERRRRAAKDRGVGESARREPTATAERPSPPRVAARSDGLDAPEARLAALLLLVAAAGSLALVHQLRREALR
jgi:hypothetical protein